MNKSWLPHPLILLSSSLLALSSPLYSLGFLVWIAFIPLIYVLNQQNSYKGIIKQSFYHQLFFSIGIFFWVPSAFQELWTDASIWVHTIFFLFLIAIVELQFISWAIVRHYFKNKVPFYLLILISGITYSIFDSTTLKFFNDTLTHALYDHYSIKQLVPYVGIYSLTALIVIVNELFLHFKSSIKVLVPICIMLIAYGSGESIRQYKKMQPVKTTLKISIIQPNLSNLSKKKLKKSHPDDYKTMIVKDLINQVKETMAKYPQTKIILLPESIYPIYYYSPESFKEQSINLEFEKLVIDYKIDLFFGGAKKENNLNANVYIHLFYKDGQIGSDYYTKMKLFPFGEKIPFTETLPFLQDWFPMASVSYEGQKHGIKYLNNIKIGTAICYETITSDLSKTLGEQGIQILLNPTNESFFTAVGEPQLALALTSFRALEQGIPVVRSAATGISGHINFLGEIIDQTKMNEKIIRYYEVEIR